MQCAPDLLHYNSTISHRAAGGGERRTVLRHFGREEEGRSFAQCTPAVCTQYSMHALRLRERTRLFDRNNLARKNVLDLQLLSAERLQCSRNLLQSEERRFGTTAGDKIHQEIREQREIGLPAHRCDSYFTTIELLGDLDEIW